MDPTPLVPDSFQVIDMIDIDAEFRRVIGVSSGSTNAKSNADEPLTIEKLREAKRKLDALGQPPPKVRLSKHAPVWVTAKPAAEPSTDDMRTMCEDIGPQNVPGCFRISTQFEDMVLINPVHFKEK